jgi:hypothetical protein
MPTITRLGGGLIRNKMQAAAFFILHWGTRREHDA